MTMVLSLVFIITAASFGLALYFRVAEYDILASDKVWDRIAPAAQALIDDEHLPDSIAGNIALFAMATGCGCFTSVMLRQSVSAALGRRQTPPSDAFQETMDNLPAELRHRLFTLFEDLILFDSLHSPILGRICRVIHRRHFSRSRYRIPVSPEREDLQIARITTAFESAIAKKADPELIKFRDLIPA